MATIGSSNFTVMRYTEEAASSNAGYPANSTIQEIPMTGESFQYSSQFISSQNINSSRQASDQIQTSFEVAGGLQIEFAPKVYDELIEGAMWADWQATAKDADYELTTTTAVAGTNGGTLADTDAGEDMTTGLVVGQWFYLRSRGLEAAAITSSNVGIYKVLLVTENLITLDESTPITAIDTEKTCTICASTMKAPEDGKAINMKRHKYFFERQHADLDQDQFFGFGGNLVNNWSINGASASLLTGSFDFMGENATIRNSGIYNLETNPNGQATGDGETPEAPTTATANLGSAALDDAYAGGDGAHAAAGSFNGFNAVSHIKGIYLDGVDANATASGDIYIQSLDFTIANNLRGAQAIGHMGNIAVQAGQLNITGNIASYFANDKMYRRFLSGEEFSLEYVVEDENNDAYVFSFPRVTISTSSMNAGGNDQDLIENMQWTALYDDTAGVKTSMRIDRLYSDYTDTPDA